MPKVSVIVPSLDGYREGKLPRLLRQIEEQSFKDLEVIVVKGVSPQGKSINQGVRESKGEILVIMDDDSELGSPRVIENLVKTIEEEENVGMVGASVTIPLHASWFQRRAAREFPRFSVPVVSEVTESDMACHGCCAFPRRVFEEIGGEREEIVRGLDPDLRHRLREKGYRVVLAPHSPVYHPFPSGLSGFLRLFFRNGKGSAFAQRFQPHLVYETDERVRSTRFQEKRSFIYRLFRFPLRLIYSIMTFKVFRFLGYTAYGLGFLWGWWEYSSSQRKDEKRENS